MDLEGDMHRMEGEATGREADMAPQEVVATDLIEEDQMICPAGWEEDL